MARAGTILRHGLLAALVVAGFGATARGEESDTLAPYLMLRSLQFVQDSVIRGDHSAGDMQRFLLGKLDARLRQMSPKAFADPRNVDAAVVYAMSGGNPATLEFIVNRDVDGHFDNRVTDLLRKYLSGKGLLVANSIVETVPLYRNSRIAPYLALVAGNVLVVKDPAKALQFYDWARLDAPGTIVEEAALRRSLTVALDTNQAEKAMAYANRYTRRFLYSPYASQFADLFVELVVNHYKELKDADITGTLAWMDTPRQREIYLRIARRSAISGDQALTRLASDRAMALAGLPQGDDPQALLYGGVARIPTTDVAAALEAMSALPQEDLSASDKALLEAARIVAQQVLELPRSPPSSETVPALPAQPDGRAGSTPGGDAAAESAQQDPLGEVASRPARPDGNGARPAPPSPGATPSPLPAPVPAPGAGAGPGAPAAAQPAAARSKGTAEAAIGTDPAFQTFVSQGRAKLEEIDTMLSNGEGAGQ